MRKNLLKYFNSWFRITHNLSNDMGVSGNVLKRPENERTFFLPTYVLWEACYAPPRGSFKCFL